MLFEPKKDGRIRFCVYYRKLNTASVRDSYQLHRMEIVLNLSAMTRFFPSWIRTADTGKYRSEREIGK